MPTSIRHAVVIVSIAWLFTQSPVAGGEFLFQPLAGEVGATGFQDGLGAEAHFSNPGALAAGPGGFLYVADSLNHAIRKVSPAGQVTTLAGRAVDSDFDGINEGGAADGFGAAARFNYPAGLAVDETGFVFVSDAWNHTIRKITPAGLVTTLAGQAGNYGHRDGPAAQALFDDPCGIAVDSQGNLFVVERGGHIIRRISHDGMVSTFAGFPGLRGAADGQGENARFDRPSGLALDSEGCLWVADSGNHTIRRITPEGFVTTVAGTPGVFGHLDGEASTALFFEPMGVAVDKDGTAFVADTYNNAVRKLNPDGKVETLRTIGSSGGDEAASEPGSQFAGPSGLLISGSGVLLVADAGNNVIQTGVEVSEVSLRVSLEGGLPVLHIAGGMGRSCTIEVRSDASPGGVWSPLATLELTSHNVAFVDHTAPGVPFRLYRVRP